MAFSRSLASSHIEESYSVSANYDDTTSWPISDTDSVMLQSDVLPPALAPSWDVDATINPALLVTRHQDLETFPNEAAPIQHS